MIFFIQFFQVMCFGRSSLPDNVGNLRVSQSQPVSVLQLLWQPFHHKYG